MSTCPISCARPRTIFLNPRSSKYLFREEIRLEGRRVPIREAANFADRDPEAVNICFTTIQALHRGLEEPREDALTYEELEGRPVILLSDEAHHLSAATKADKKEAEAERTWEYTVNRLLNAHEDNLLLEFTATCDLSHPALKAAYEPRIVFDYPLRRFREDGFSKEIKTLRSDLSVMDKALQALMLSQYRLKLFEEHRLAVKPVVLFKALNVAQSREFRKDFQDRIGHLTGADLERVAEQGSAEILLKAYAYFRDRGFPSTSWRGSCNGSLARPAVCPSTTINRRRSGSSSSIPWRMRTIPTGRFSRCASWTRAGTCSTCSISCACTRRGSRGARGFPLPRCRRPSSSAGGLGTAPLRWRRDSPFSNVSTTGI